MLSRRTVNLGPRNTVRMGKGDRFVMWTPGGGAYGRAGDTEPVEPTKAPAKQTLVGMVGSLAERAAAQLGV